MQYDSWWYRRGPDDGVDEWLPDTSASIFPSGEFPRINLPSQLHNRYWSRTTKMANRFPFVRSEIGAARSESFPIGQPYYLFREIIGHAVKNFNLSVYEQDWLQNEFSEEVYPMQIINAAEVIFEFCFSKKKNILIFIIILD